LNRVAIVIPFFNEELRIGNGQYLRDLSKVVCADFYYVDDGSTDNTKGKLIELSHITKARFISLESNVGKGEAIRAGLMAATCIRTYDFIGYLDADGAFPVSEVIRSTDLANSIFHDIPSVDIFIAARIKLAGKDISRSSIRHYLSRMIITIIGLRTKNMPYDSQSGLKYLRNSDRFRSALDRPFGTRWFFDLELMSRLGMQERNCTWEEPVNSWSDINGSKIGIGSVLSIAKELRKVMRILAPS
jgi:glycosyltransferase involved in cell wall biosynthesis